MSKRRAAANDSSWPKLADRRAIDMRLATRGRNPHRTNTEHPLWLAPGTAGAPAAHGRWFHVLLDHLEANGTHPIDIQRLFDATGVLPCSFISQNVALPVDWYVEPGPTTWPFEWLEVTLRRQCYERLLLAGR